MTKYFSALAILAAVCPSALSQTSGSLVGWGEQAIPYLEPGTQFSAVAAGAGHTLALKNDGAVIGWGNNRFGESSSPPGLRGVIAIAAGRSYNLALKNDGTVVAWGYNNLGQTTIPPRLTGVVAIAAGWEHNLALKNDGTVVAWGQNRSGQSTVPPGLSGVIAVAAGRDQSLALKNDGTVVAWGYTAFGASNAPSGLNGVIAVAAGAGYNLALKNDGTVVAWGYNTVPNGLSGVIAIAAEWSHSLALRDDGTVIAWGSNDWGQSTVPNGLTGVVAIAAGATHSVAVKNDGTVIAWGDNSQAQSMASLPLAKISAISAGRFHSLALKNDGTVLDWGLNIDGQTGVPPGLSGVIAISAGGEHSLALKSDRTVVAWGDPLARVPTGLNGVVAIAAGESHSLALKNGGTVTAWGYNEHGESTVPSGLTGVIAIAAGTYHSLTLKNDGRVVAWGDNSTGQTSVPPELNGVVGIAAGFRHSLALKNNGTVVAWGWNSYGQSTVPSGLTGVIAVAAGYGHSLALKNDGTVVGWGKNEWGESSPPTSLSRVVAITAGGSHNLALIRPAPEIDVAGNGVSIGDGDTAPSLADHTDFGSSEINGGTVEHTFTIQNRGTAPLNLTGTPKVMVSGPDARDFAVTLQPNSVVTNLTDVVPFQVTFNPSAIGLRRATLIIANDDSDENPYDFAIQGGGVDTTSPNLSCPHDVTAVTDFGQCYATGVRLGFPTISDNSGAVTVTSNALARFPVGVTEVIWSALDPSGNTSSCSQRVTVIDATPPTFDCPATVTVSADAGRCSKANVTWTTLAMDNCDPDPSVTCAPPSGSTFPLGATVVTCVAVDRSSNTSTCSFSITVKDVERPQIGCPADIAVDFASTNGSAVPFEATANENCASTIAVNCTPAQGSTFPIGTTTVLCTATDAARNTASCRFQITVRGAQSVIQQVLSELIALRASVTSRADADRLDAAIGFLSAVLDSGLWLDETHLDPKQGDQVFQREKDAVTKLRDLINDLRSALPRATLEGLVARLVKTDWLLAEISLEEARAAGLNAKKIAQDLDEIAKGDADVAVGRAENAIEHYRNAWKHAVHLQLKGAVLPGGANVRLQFLAFPGERYVLQTSTNLADWTALETVTAKQDGTIDVEDQASAECPRRFYRVVAP